MPSREDQILEAAIAEEAGAGYSALRERPGADDLGRRADRLSHEYILEALTNACPGDAVLSEEGPDDHARLSADRVWIVDPTGRHPGVCPAPQHRMGCSHRAMGTLDDREIGSHSGAGLCEGPPYSADRML
jgi:Inositol monophosphatase family